MGSGRCAGKHLWAGLSLLLFASAAPGEEMLAEQIQLTAQPATQASWPEPKLDYAAPLRMDQLTPEDFYWDDEPRYLAPTDRLWHSAADWAIRQQETQSRRVDAMSRGIDRFLSGEEYTVRDNTSYLRLGLSNQYDKAGEMGVEPEVRFRLDLPTVEERFRLVIESDPDDLTSLSEQQQDDTLREDERSDSFTAGALRLLIPVRERWDLSTDVGARLRFPPEAFWRARARSNWQLPAQWTFRVDQRFYYFNTDGWGERTWLAFDRPVGPAWSFRSSSEAQWVHKDRLFEVAQVLRIDRIYRNHHYFRYRLGVLGESEPNWQTTRYFGDMLYRNRLYSDWLFGEVIPSLAFPRDDNFKPNPSITLRIEMYFSGRGSL